MASAPPTGASVFAPVPDPEDRAARQEFVEGLILSGAPRSRILSLARRKGYQPFAVEEDIRAIRTAHAAEQAEHEKTRRSDQLSRLRNDLLRMRSEAKPPWSAIATCEKLISEIEGNLAPRRLEVGLSAIPDALAAAVSSMTPESIEAAIAEELEREKNLQALVVSGEPAASPPG